MSAPSIVMRPEDTWSSPAATCMSVDLPEPDGPITAVNSPAPMSTLTSSSAVTRRAASP